MGGPGRGLRGGRGHGSADERTTRTARRSKRLQQTTITNQTQEGVEVGGDEGGRNRGEQMEKLKNGYITDNGMQIKIKQEALDEDHPPPGKQARLYSPKNEETINIEEDGEEIGSDNGDRKETIEEKLARLEREQPPPISICDVESSDDEKDLLTAPFPGTPRKSNQAKTVNVIEPTPVKTKENNEKDSVEQLLRDSQRVIDEIEEEIDDEDLYSPPPKTNKKAEEKTDKNQIREESIVITAIATNKKNPTETETPAETNRNNQEEKEVEVVEVKPPSKMSMHNDDTETPSTRKENEGNTPATTLSKPVAATVKPLYSQVALDVSKTVGHRYEISFHCPFQSNERFGAPIRDQKIVLSYLQGVVLHLLNTGLHIDSRFQLLSWANDRPAITKPEQIPKTHAELYKYMNPADLVMRNGMNFFWRVRKRHDGLHFEDFIRAWEGSKQVQRNFNSPHGYVTIKTAPVQNEVWYDCGYLIGTSEGQCMDFNEKKLREEFGEEDLYISHHNIDIKNFRMVYWNRANAKATKLTGDNKRTPNFFKARALSSPCGFQVYTKNQLKVKDLKKKLRNRLGKRTSTKNWPTLPDGCETMFVPAMNHDAKTMADKMTLEHRMDKHIEFKESKIRVDIKIKDPDLQPACLKGKTISQAILGGYHHTEDNFSRPIFHSFELKWNRNRRIKEYQICFFQTMKEKATAKLKTLVDDLVKIYGEDVKNCFYLSRASIPAAMRGPTGSLESMYGIELDSDDEDDPYFSGKLKVAVDLTTMEGGNVNQVRHPGDDLSTVRDSSLYGDNSTNGGSTNGGSTNGGSTAAPTALAPGFQPPTTRHDREKEESEKSNEQLPGTPSGSPPKKPSVQNPFGKYNGGNPYSKKKEINNSEDASKQQTNQPPSSPPRDGFKSTGSPEAKKRMDQARRLAVSIINPPTLPVITKHWPGTLNTPEDRRYYLKKITGTLNPIEKALLYNDEKAPDEPLASLKGLGIQKDYGEDFTEEEIENIIEHHAQYILQTMTQPGKTDGPGNKK